jgi:hypothetical protein
VLQVDRLVFRTSSSRQFKRSCRSAVRGIRSGSELAEGFGSSSSMPHRAGRRRLQRDDVLAPSKQHAPDRGRVHVADRLADDGERVATFVEDASAMTRE